MRRRRSSFRRRGRAGRSRRRSFVKGRRSAMRQMSRVIPMVQRLGRRM